MAITKTTENDKIEVVNKWNIQVRTATVIKEDGVELTRSFHRKVLVPGTLKGGDGADKDTLVETDLSSEDADVKAIAESAWGVGTVKADYTAFLVANKSTTP
tara:strand:- start:41 stop:346 length:306 start_codon:yes stop_codon:yes gene_type:complete